MYFLWFPRNENPKQAQAQTIAKPLDFKYAIVINGFNSFLPTMNKVKK